MNNVPRSLNSEVEAIRNYFDLPWILLVEDHTVSIVALANIEVTILELVKIGPMTAFTLAMIVDEHNAYLSGKETKT